MIFLEFWQGQLLEIILCYGTLVLLSRYQGVYGLYAFAIIGPMIGNIQALKATSVSYFNHPIALGTVIFASLNVCIDGLVEYAGLKYAKQAIWLGFIAFFLMTLLLGLTVLYLPPSFSTPDAVHFQTMHTHLTAIFTPLPGLFVASLVAYLVSQYQDILLFSWLRKHWQHRFLALRTFISSSIAGFVDSFIFNILAWIVLSPTPLSFKTVFFSHILSTYSLRLILGIVTTPLIYWLKPLTLPKMDT